MSKLMTTLEKLDYFSKQHQALQAETSKLNKQAENLDKEWREWITALGLTGQVHFADVVKKAIEGTIDQPRIVAP